MKKGMNRNQDFTHPPKSNTLNAHEQEKTEQGLTNVPLNHTSKVHTNLLKQVASAGDDGSIHLWDIVSDECRLVLKGHKKRVNTLASSPQGHLLASGSADSTIRIWDALSGQCVTMLKDHTDSITDITYSLDGKYLASASADTTIRLWYTDTWKLKTVLSARRHVNSVSFSLKVDKLVSTHGDETISVWGLNTNSCEQYTKKENITDAVYSPVDNKKIAYSYADGTIWISSGIGSNISFKSAKPSTRLCFSPDGKVVVGTSGIFIADMTDTGSPDTLYTKSPRSSNLILRDIAFSPNSKQVVTAQDDHIVSLIDLAESSNSTIGSLISEYRGHMSPVRCVAFAPEIDKSQSEMKKKQPVLPKRKPFLSRLFSAAKTTNNRKLPQADSGDKKKSYK